MAKNNSNKKRSDRRPNDRGSKKPGFKSFDKESPEERDLKGGTKSNDPTWYMRNSANAEWVGRLAFTKPLGTPIIMTSATSKGKQIYPDYVPGVMTLGLTPTIGVAKAPSDAVNACATKYFTNVRSKISGSRSYVAPDLMIYTIGAAQLYSMYVWGARLYAIARTFDQQNRYVGDTLLKANRVQPDDFRQHVGDWLFFLNQFAVKINSFAVPNDINYFKRQMYLYSGIYKDSNASKAQLYMNVPDGFMYYNGTASENGGILSVKQMPTSGLKYADLVSYFNDILGAMYGDEDMYTMSGDVYKAYAPNVLLANSVSADYTVNIIYDEAVLSQFENANAVGPLRTLDMVTQDANSGILLCNPKFFLLGHKGSGCDFNRIMNFHHTDVSSADVFEAAPLCCLPVWDSFDSTSGASGDIYAMRTMGTEVATSMAIWTMNNGVPNVKYEGASTFTQLGSEVDLAIFQIFSDLSNFDWHPLIYQTYNASASGTTTGQYDLYGIYGDLDTYRVMSESDLANIHDCALWSLFDVV